MFALVVSSVLALQAAAEAMVDCGGHFETGCDRCPQGNKWAWCNGDCTWMQDPVNADLGMCISQVSLGGGLRGGANFYYWSLQFLGGGFLMLIFACIYYSKIIVGPPSMNRITGVSGWRLGIFDCLKKPHTCLHVTFCLPVVVGKNYYAAEVMGFWPGCLISYALIYSPLYPIGVLFRIFMSVKMQEKLGFKDNNFIVACFHNLFCMPCVVGRESLEVDCETGAEIKCCCQFTQQFKVAVEVSNLVEKGEQTISRSCQRTCLPGGH